MGDKVRFTGAWKHVEMWLDAASRGDLSDKAKERIEAVGTHLVHKVRRNIAKQALPWQALSPITVEIKGFNTIYLETGEYRSSIGIEVKSKGDHKTEVRVGPSDSIARKGLSFQTLAAYLEYGTSKMPARPLWRPTFIALRRSPKWKKLAAEVVEDF